MKLSAEIFEPTGESDNPLKFLAGFVLGVPLDAEIRGLVLPQNLRVRVRYPDQQTQLTIPQESHLKVMSQFDSDSPTGEENAANILPEYRLRTTVLVSHQTWTESSFVELDLVFLCPERGNPVIELCKPVRILVSPKPVKRGI